MIVLQEDRGAVRLITLNRPKKRHAINAALADALCNALDTASDDDTVRAVVLGASGERAFAAGGDLDELKALPQDGDGAAKVLELTLTTVALEQCAVPVIAAMNGDAFGGGAELVMGCDLLVMAKQAGLSFVHAQIGLVPAWGGATRLVERVGAAIASELLFSATRIAAPRAHALGLCNRIAAPGAATNVAIELARDITRHDRAAIVRLKQSLLAIRRERRGQCLELEREVFRQAWGSKAHKRAFSALSN